MGSSSSTLRARLVADVRAILSQFEDAFSEAKFDVRWSDDTLLIGIECMYELGSLASFACMTDISDALGTRHLNVLDRDYIPGCSTCDYGSSDKMTIAATWPEGDVPK